MRRFLQINGSVIALSTIDEGVPCKFLMDAGVRELHLFEKLSRVASFCRRFFCKSCPSMSATFNPLVDEEDFRPANRLSPAGPPPTHTTSYISGALGELEAHRRWRWTRKRTAGVQAARRAAKGIRGDIASAVRQIASAGNGLAGSSCSNRWMLDCHPPVGLCNAATVMMAPRVKRPLYHSWVASRVSLTYTTEVHI